MTKTTSNPILQLIRQALDVPGFQSCSDEDLLQRFLADRDEAAFEAILRRHGPMVLDVCRATIPNEADAEDAFQATFLVLARNAASIRGAGSLGGWLHGVARRTALKAKAQFARRRKHEGAAAVPESPARNDPPWSEVRRVVHEELSLLSERYRGPLVLCYLQGQTQDQAAAALNMSKGTLKRRVERGRALLRQRLLKRGLGLAGVLLASAWPEASANVPPTLLRAAVRAGAQPATAAPHLLALAAGGVPHVVGTPAKLLAAAALILVLAGAGLLLNFPAPPREPSPLPAEPPAAPEVASGRTDLHGDPLPAKAVARLGTERFRSDTWISQVAVVPGGKQLLGLGSRDVIMWDAGTGKEVRRFAGPPWWQAKDGASYSVRIESFAVSPDGTRLAAGTTGAPKAACPILLFDVATGKKLAEWPGHAGTDWSANSSLAFVTSNLLVSAGADKTARVWDVTAGQELRRLVTPEKGTVSDLIAAPDGKLVFGTEWDEGQVGWAAWDVATGKVTHREAGLPGNFVNAALSPDGTAFALTVGLGEVQKDGGSNEVRVYSAPDWKERRRWQTHTGRYPQRNSVAFAQDGKTLATGGADQQVRRWDLATGKEVGEPITPYTYANNVSFLDAGTLITHDAQNVLKFWDVATGQPKLDFGGAEAHLAALAYSPDGRHIAVGGGGGDATVRVWNVAAGRQVAHLKGGLSDVTCLQFSPDGRLIASADSGGAARLWDWNAGREIRAFKDHKPWLHCVAFSPDGRQLATGDDGGVVRVWDVEGGKLVRSLAGHSAHVTALAFAPDGRALISGGWDHTVRRWDLTNGREQYLIKAIHDAAGNQKGDGHSSVVTSLALSSTGRWLYSGSYDHTICVWDAASGRQCQVLKKPERGYSSVNAMALSPDGRLLAAALGDEGQESAVHLWDVLTGQKLGAWPGHRGKVAGVAFSPDGRRLTSCSVDTTALIWDVAGLAAERPAADDQAVARLWDDLGAGEPQAVYAAVCRGAVAGDKAVAALKGHLKPVAAVDPEKVAGWVTMLDAAAFADRDRASKALANLGPGAEPLLRKAIAQTESAEVRSRLERIVDGLLDDHPRSTLAVEVLEVIGTPEAKHVLTELAGGVADATLTREAASALRRLANRP